MTVVDPVLEANYNIAAARGGLDDVMQSWSALSAAFREQADAILDCAYGSGERERIDIFRCGASAAPLYVYLHGGYWQRGDKSLYSFIAAPFLEAGVDVAIVGYPLCPQVSMTDLVGKLRQAIGWLYHNAGQLGVNRERINLSGHSAGGHLTAMAVCCDWPDFDEKLPRDLLKTAIPFSGLYQLAPLLQTSISDALHLTSAEVSRLSPASLKPRTQIPLLTIVGGAETAEFFRQTDLLIESWSGLIPQIDRHVEPDVDHIDLIDRLASPDSQIFQRIINWLR
jgi:arylformamidase